MTNYGDFDPSSSISIEGTSHDFSQRHHNQQQQNHNWILLNKHETLADQQQISSKRILYHKPIVLSTPSTSQASDFVHRPTRNALQRMESVNRLNDRIRRKLETNNNEIYASTSIFDDYIHPKHLHHPIKEEEGSLDDRTNIPSETSNRRADRVVDDSFRFISDENGGTRLQTPYGNDINRHDSSRYDQINNNGQNNIDRRHMPISQIKKPSNFQRYQSQVAAAAAAQQQQAQQQYPRSQQQPLRQRGGGDRPHSHSHKQYPRSLTDPLLTTTTTTKPKNFSHHHHSTLFNDTQQQQPQPSTSRGGNNENDFFEDVKRNENFLPPSSTKSQHPNPNSHIHNIPIKMIRKRADSLDSGSLRLNGNINSYNNRFERDPHPTPLTASDWQTPAISRRPSISHQKHDSFQIPDRRPFFKNRGYPSFNDHNNSRYEPPTRRISQNIPQQQQRHRQVPYRRPSKLPRKTPSLLRRDSYYYKKCDICLNEIRPDGYPCYACNSVNTYRNNPRMTRRISRSEYLQSKNYIPPQQRKLPTRIPSTSAGAAATARLPSQPPPPPPVTIEPYFEQVDEESGETSSNSSAAAVGVQEPVQARPYPSTGWQATAAATIPPRTPSQNDFFRDQRFRFSTSPRRSNRGVLNAEGLQKHPSYLAYRKASNIPTTIPPTYIPSHRVQPSPNQQSRQSTVIWPSNAGPAWKSIDPRSRVNPSPIFRYGKQVPKWLYDYDAYAEEQRHKELKQRRQKVFAIITVFLLFALVVAAGVVLAAVN